MPSRLANEQQHDLQTLTSKIEKALRYGTRTEESDEISGVFDDANAALKDYLKKYNIGLGGQATDFLTSEEAIRQDQEAGQHIQTISDLVKQKLEKLKKVPLMDIRLQVWSDEPTSLHRVKIDGKKGFKLEYNTTLLINEIKIEKQATLNMLLHRFMEYAASIKEFSNSVTLIQYPQFYSVFPSKKREFAVACKAQGMNDRICSLDPSKTVHEAVATIHKGITNGDEILQLIIERKPRDNMALTLWDESSIKIPDEYKNAWLLSDSEDSVVVRMRTPSFSLWLWHPPTRPSAIPTQSPSSPLQGTSSGKQTDQPIGRGGSTAGRTRPENVPLEKDIDEAAFINVGAKTEDAPKKALVSNQVQMGQPNVAKAKQPSREVTTNSRRTQVANRDTLARVKESERSPSMETLHRPMLKHMDESDRTLVGEQAPPEPTSLDGSIGTRSTTGLYQPALEHADSSNPTLVGSSSSARSQARLLPTFEGDLIQGSMTIGMTAVPKPKKKQGWFSSFKSILGFV